MIIAVGAVGGSGTRVVAQMLIQCGVYLGDFLNAPLDNLLFTSLFKNPEWYKEASINEKKYRFQLFSKYMSGKRLSLYEKTQLLTASANNATYNPGRRFLLKLLFEGKKQSKEFWGWKEPNTQIYIEELASFFPDIKYVHVIRNGLDMAFSKNKQQLHNWGFLYGIETYDQEGDEEIAKKLLEYWIRSNQSTINKGKNLLGNNFYLLNHQKLCEQPEIEIHKLIGFLDIKLNDGIIRDLIQIPVIPETYNRYLDHDLSIFSSVQLNEVTELGFNIS